MGKSIPLEVNPALEIEIDAAPIAAALALDPAEFLRLLALRKIDQLCERGTGPDSGRYRASYYHAGRRARVVVDREGRMLGAVELRQR